MYDDNGHGTKVSGIIAGRGIVSHGIYTGVAPDLQLIILKVFNKEGRTSLITFSEAVQWILENKVEYNIRLVCMASGFPLNEDFYNIVIEDLTNRLIENNILLITSSGNGGINGNITLPGDSDNVFTVGSLAYDPLSNTPIDQAPISEFTSRKSNNRKKPDLYAPGESIITTSNDGGYAVVEGTSYSAALATGQIALIMRMFPTKNAKEMISLIKSLLKNKVIYYKPNILGG